MFEVQILTPQGNYYETEAERLTIPTEDGVRTLLKNHISTVMPLREGQVVIKKEDRMSESETIDITAGLFYFDDNEARLFVRSFEA